MNQGDASALCSSFDLEVEAEDGKYSISLFNKPLRTPGGNRLQHPRRSVVEAAIQDLRRRGELRISLHGLAITDSLMVELLTAEIDHTVDSVSLRIAGDPLLSGVTSSSERIDSRIQAVVDSLKEIDVNGELETNARVLCE